ncbi:hypothetical protein QE381_002848 [Microbacterium sp. SORGH_AS 888]|nr:hypothetical protein [Microbacterium sp. SORGH_AS_0888]
MLREVSTWAGEEVDVRICGDRRHPLVVRGERGTHQDAEHGELHPEERAGEPQRQDEEDGPEIDAEARGQEHALQDASGRVRAAGTAAHDGDHGMAVKVEALQCQQREEQPALVPDDPSDRASSALRVLGKEHDGVRLDVGILADRVRVGVVPVVLVRPPRVAEADHERADVLRGAVVPGPRREDLPVRGLVGQERELGEQHAEGDGDAQLEPGVSEHGEDDPARRRRQHEAGEQHPVEAAPAAKQARILHLSQQRGVCRRPRRDAAVRRADGCADAADHGVLGGHDVSLPVVDGTRRRSGNRGQGQLRKA